MTRIVTVAGAQLGPVQLADDRADVVAGPIGEGVVRAGLDERLVGSAVFQATFTEGATNAFLVGSIMMLGASLVVWTLLDVKHAELATDGPEGAPVHAG